MRKNRKIALVLAVALLVAMLAGCSSSSTPETEEPAETQEASEAPETQETEAPAESDEAQEETAEPEAQLNYTASGTPTYSYEYDLPLFPDEDVSYSMWVSFSDNMSTFMPNEYYDNTAYQKSVELTGVDIDFTCVTTTANAEKFNLMIASQEYVDIITGVAQLWSQSYDYAIEEEIFLDLTEMVENYMPAYYQLYQTLDNDVIKDLHTDEGYMPKLIALNFDYADATEGPMIRTDYLEDVGLDMPVTYDDWDEVLHAFKSELGISQPLMLPKGIVHTSNSMVSGYDVLGTFSTFPMASAPWYQVDGQIKFGIVEDGYKEYIDMISGWYNEGIINPEFIVLNDNPMGSTYTAEITSGNAGIFFAEGALLENYVVAGSATDPDFAIWGLQEPVKEEGQITHFASKKSPISGRLANIVVTTAVEDIEKLGKYLDWYYTEDGGLLASVGVEDEAWVYADDGSLVYADTWLASDLADNEKPTKFIFSVMPCLYPESTPEEEDPDYVDAAPVAWETNTDSAYALPSGISLTAEESEDYQVKFSDIQTYLEENISKFVVGDRDLSEWDAFIDEVWGLGLQDCMDIYQGAMDRYASR